MKTLLIPAAFLAASPALAASVPLASTMQADSFISEDSTTGVYAQISLGNGSLGSAGANTGDADGLYNLADFGQPNPQSFGAADVFPREADFVVGSLEIGGGTVTGVGVETTAVTAIDLGELWSPDPNRTNGTPGSPPTVVSDISDRAIGLWFFDAGGSITFGPLDASDTVTFTGGVLTSIDVELTVDFVVDTSVYSGTLAFAGDSISLQINDQAPGFFGLSTLVADLQGQVLAVGSFAIPEPTGALLMVLGGAIVGGIRRR